MKPGTIAAIIISVLFLGLFLQYQHRAPSRGFSDYRVYYDAGKNILEGRNIYQTHSDGMTPFKYSPFFAAAFAPLALVSLKMSAAVFYFINLLLLTLVFVLSWKMLPASIAAPQKKIFIMTATAIMSFRFVLVCLHSGQVGLLITFLILAGLLLIERNAIVAGAFLIAAAVMVKYMPAVFILYFLCKRQYRTAAWILGAVVFYIVLPAVFIGVETNVQYIREWIPYITSTSLDSGSMTDVKNNSVWTAVNRFLPGLASPASLFIVGGIFLALFVPVIRNAPKNPQEKKAGFFAPLDYALLLICMALFNPNAWQHNFVALIPAYMIAVSYMFAVRFADRTVLILAAASFVLCTWLAGSAFIDTFKIAGPFLSVIMGSLALFAALVKIKLNPSTDNRL